MYEESEDPHHPDILVYISNGIMDVDCATMNALVPQADCDEICPAVKDHSKAPAPEVLDLSNWLFGVRAAAA
jgi:hypothetical protein